MTSEDSGMSVNADKRNWVASPWKLAAVSLLFLLIIDIVSIIGWCKIFGLSRSIVNLFKVAACALLFIPVSNKQKELGIEPAGNWRISLAALAGLAACVVAVLINLEMWKYPLHNITRLLTDEEFLHVLGTTCLITFLDSLVLFSQFILLCLPLALLRRKPRYAWKALVLVLLFSALYMMNSTAQFVISYENLIRRPDYYDQAVKAMAAGLLIFAMLMLAHRASRGMLFDTAALFLPAGIALQEVPFLIPRLVSYYDWTGGFPKMDVGAAAFLAVYTAALGLAVLFRRRKKKKPIETGSP